MKTNYIFKARWLQGVASENGSKKMRVNPRITPVRFAFALLLLLTFGVGNVWGADKTTTWTASSGALGSGIGSGTINTTVSGTGTTQSWSYTRTLSSGSSYTGWSSNCIQLGKNGGVENLTLSTSNIPGTIKSVSVECSSYQGKHNVSITVGSTTYLSSTATASWTTVSAKSGTGTSSGTITISFTGGSRALYIKSITVVYNNDDAPVTYGVTYNANGDGAGNATGTYGSVPTDNTSYSSGASVTVAGRGTLGKVGHSFAGWNTAANGSGTPYAAGATFSISANTTLYAQWTNTYAGDEFSLVEDLSEISAGSKIIILDEDHATAMSTNQASNNRASVAASADGGFTLSNSNKTVTLKSATTVQIITLEDLATPVSNRYQFNVENGYLYAASSGSNYMRTQTTNDANGHWQISLTSGTFGVVAQGSNTYNVLQKNSSSALYSCYNSASQKNVLLYVKEEGTKYAITWNKNGHGTAPTSPTSAARLTLPDISVTGYTNTGWKANQAVTNVATSSSISAGTLIVPGTRVQLGAATTFTAQWETASYTITATLTNTTVSSAFPASVTYSGSSTDALDRTFTASSGYQLPTNITVTMGGEAQTKGTHYSYDNSTGEFSFDVAVTGDIEITVSSDLLYTYTFNPGTGACATTTLQGTAANGITIPSISTVPCTSDGWSFAGWGTLEVTAETTTRPTILVSAGSNYKSASNTTFYAVYQRGDGKYHKITETPSIIPGKYVIVNVSSGQALKNTIQSTYYMAAGGVTISDNKINSPDASVVWDVTYSNNKWLFKNGNNYLYNYGSSTYYDLGMQTTPIPNGYTVSFDGSGYAILTSADDERDNTYVKYYLYNTTHEFMGAASNDGTYNVNLFRLERTYFTNPTCCTDPELAFDYVNNYQTFVREDIGGARGGNGSATIEQGKATLELDYVTESDGACSIEVKKLTGGDTRSTSALGTDCSNHTSISVDGSSKVVTFDIWTYCTSYPCFNGQGTYRIKLTQAASSPYCASTAYYFVDVVLRDKFVDAVNSNSTINKDGESATVAAPQESDMDAAKNDDCHDTTRRLLGWVNENDLQTMYGADGETGFLEDAAKYEANKSKIVAPGATGITTTGATWYAVWGEEEE